MGTRGNSRYIYVRACLYVSVFSRVLSQGECAQRKLFQWRTRRHLSHPSQRHQSTQSHHLHSRLGIVAAEESCANSTPTCAEIEGSSMFTYFYLKLSLQKSTHIDARLFQILRVFQRIRTSFLSLAARLHGSPLNRWEWTLDSQ